MKSVLAFLLLIGGLAHAQDITSLSIQEAVQMGIEHSRILKGSNSTLAGARAREDEVGAAMLPQLKVEAAYRRLSEVDPFQVSLPVSTTPIVLAPSIGNNYSVRVGLQQPLFTGFRLSSNAKAAEYLSSAAALDVSADRSLVILRIHTAYWMLHQVIESKKFIDENVLRIQRHLEDTERLVQSGLVTRNDHLKIELQLSNSKLAQIDAIHDVRIATMNLNNLLGQKLDRPVTLSSSPSDLTIVDKRPSDYASVLVEAQSTRPDLDAMRSRVMASGEAVSAAQAGWWPTLFISANMHYSRPNPRYLPALDEFRNSWDIGVVLQLDLWNWGITSHQVEQARAQFRTMELLFDQLEDNVEVEVAEAYFQVEQTDEKINVSQLAVQSAEENARTTGEKYRNGLATSSDLVDAEVDLLRAQTNLTGALVQHRLSVVRLEKAIGRIE